MNKYLLYHGAFAAVCVCTLSPMSQTARAADVAASSAVAQLPINLARGDLGSRLEARAPKIKDPEKTSVEENESAQALVSDDAALTYPLLPGRTSIIVTLSKIQALNHFNFLNFGAGGRFQVSVSSTKLGFDAPGWRTVASEGMSSSAVVSADLGSVEARYVKVDFDTEREGRISGFGLFGTPTIGAFEKKPLGYAFADGAPSVGGFSSAESRNVYFDLANLDTGARVVALSRGGDLDAAQTMIDGNVESGYAFDSTDPAPAVVVDFGMTRVVNRLSCVFDAPPGRLDFYLVDNPYPKGDRRVAMNYVGDPTVMPVSNESGEYSGRNGSQGRQAIYSVNTSSQPGLNRLAADMTGQKGRFLVAEFHPTGSAAPDFKDFKDRTVDYKDRDFKDQPTAANAPASQPLRILSLSAFGENPPSGTVPQIPPPGGPTTVVTPPPPISPPGSGAMTP